MTEQVLDTPNTQETVQVSQTDNTPDYSYLSDKFKVYKDDTNTDLDINSTLQKLNDSYTALEKKLGSRSVLSTPKPVELDLSEFEESYLENNKDLVELAKASGLSKDTFKAITDLYNNKLNSVLEFKEQETYESTIDQLESMWGKDTETQINYANDAIIKLGFSEDEINNVANNVAFIKLAAAFGSQLGEHKAPLNTTNSTSTLKELMTSEAYSNSKHPDYKSVHEQVKALYEQGHSLK